MTRLTKRPKRIGGVYGDLDVEFLLGGPHGVPCAMSDADDEGDDDAIRKAWESLGEALLPKWILARPGSRPWSWWRFAAERRKTVAGRVHPFDDASRKLAIAKSGATPAMKDKAYRLHWGLPMIFVPPFDNDLHADFTQHWPDTKLFEAEWEYLARLNLLLPEDSP